MIDRILASLKWILLRLRLWPLRSTVDRSSRPPATDPFFKRPLYSHTVDYPPVSVAASQSEAVEMLARTRGLVLVQSGSDYKWLLMWCPCECGRVRRISVSAKIRPTWRLEMSKGGSVSLYPSIHLQEECRAHFILRNNRALVLSAVGDRNGAPPMENS